MRWRNEDELKQDSKNYEDRYKKVEDDVLCNITKREPYLDKDYEELENFNVLQLDEEEEDKAEVSMINPDLVDSDGVSKASAALAVVDNLLLLNQQFYVFTVEWMIFKI